MKTSKGYEEVKQNFPDLDLVLESEFRIIGYSKSHSLFYHEWLEDSPEMDEEIFKAEILSAIKAVEKYRPSLFLANDKNRRIRFNEELNEFLMYHFMPVYSHPTVKKVALVRCDYLSLQSDLELAMEQLVQNQSSQQSNFGFYDHLSQAISLLKN